jgi:ribonucleoside-diphosphate reductase beta chain
MGSLVTSNLLLALYPHLTAPEVRLYLARQAWEEANHAMASEYVIKTLPVDRERVFGMRVRHDGGASGRGGQGRFPAPAHRGDPEAGPGPSYDRRATAAFA